jgi:D-threo-aldose 1-dehydrogenase
MAGCATEVDIDNTLHPHLTSQAFPIGFGCAHLQYAYRSSQQSLRLLETAFDNGITHFDVARLYSAGKAEGIVGEFARGRRDKIILVSKVGILPLRQTFYHRLGRKVRTAIKTNAPALSGWLRPALYEPTFGRFSRKDIRNSVETSLRALKTDYLDALLLHECKCSDVSSFEVPATLEKLRAEGKILAYGIATDIEETANIGRSFPSLASIVQIPSSDLNLNVWPFLRDKDRLVITHSVLTRNLDLVASWLQAESAIRLKIQSALDLDLSRSSGVAQLLMLSAIQANSNGMVLFSTSKPEHIKSCVDAAKAAQAQTNRKEAIANFLSLIHPASYSSGEELGWRE